MNAKLVRVAMAAGVGLFLTGPGQGLVSEAQAQVDPCAEPTGDIACGCGKIHMLSMRQAAGLPIGEPGRAFGVREAYADTDVLSNDLEIELLIASGSISGRNSIRVRSMVNNLTQFTFMLRSNFTVSGVTVDGVPATASLPPANSYARVVTLPRAYALGEEFTVTIPYSGVPVSRGFGSIFYGEQNGQPLVATLSQPYYAATWWPAKDGDVFQPGDNSDKATLRFAIIAPNTLKSTANGVLEGIDELSGNRRRYRYRHDYLIPTYLVAFGTTNYNSWTVNYVSPLSGTVMPVEFNIYPASDTPTNRAAWSLSVEMLRAFAGVFGEYPFVNEKYGMYQFPFGGGMEHQTNTGQGTFAESVTAHEAAHQWWGDWVTCKNWNHIWLNEGFATYGEAIWQERRPGSSGLPALHAAMAARRPSAVNDSVYVVDTSNLNRIFSSTFSYRKGAWVLHQLRKVVGDQTFFDILAHWRELYGGSAADTTDFANVAAAVSGRDLTWFFNQWVYQIGAPGYATGWQNVTINGQNYLRVRLRQTQDATWGTGGVFTMPVDIRVDTASGSVTRTVWNDARSEHYLLPLPSPATNVAVDEFNWILTTEKIGETYVAGPPVVAASSVGPGGVAAAGATSLTVTFSDAVTVPSGAFTLTGPSGAVGVTASYAPATNTATLAFPALGPGTYTLTVRDTIQAGALALDGQVTNGALPSGDGQAGGSAVWTFTVPGCPADFDGNGELEPIDVRAFFDAYRAGDADFDGNGETEPLDVSAFFAAYRAGC